MALLVSTGRFMMPDKTSFSRAAAQVAVRIVARMLVCAPLLARDRGLGAQCLTLHLWAIQRGGGALISLIRHQPALMTPWRGSLARILSRLGPA